MTTAAPSTMAPMTITSGSSGDSCQSMSHVLKPRSTTAAASASVLKRPKMILAAWPGGVMIASVVESSAWVRVRVRVRVMPRS